LIILYTIVYDACCGTRSERDRESIVDLELEGKRAIVTGGGTGIGLAIARELSHEGAVVAVVGRRKEVLEDTATALESETGNRVLPISADISDDESVRALVSTFVAEVGGVDILVNCASENPAQRGPTYRDATDDEFARQLNTKVIGYLRTARAVAPYMIDQGWGRIINISGISVRNAYRVVSSVRNAGVTALTKNLADELGPHGINVTVLYPGYTVTDRIIAEAAHAGVALEDYLKTIYTGQAIGRPVQPHEVAWVAAFLASPKSITINGDPIPVAGGFLGSIHY
jgi:NAD(P)-dependent dehydrogenase (short-subunit alcohol dehydrogenase family)